MGNSKERISKIEYSFSLLFIVRKRHEIGRI